MNFDTIRRELRENGSVQAAADSEEAKKLMKSVDAAEVEKAASSGDSESLRRILGQVLSTPEGKALAERVRAAVRKDG